MNGGWTKPWTGVAWLLATAVIGVTIGNAALKAQGGLLGKLGIKSDVAYRTYRDPNGRFSVDYPTKDWRIVPSRSSALVIFARSNGEATLIVDAAQLTEPLAPSEVATMVDLEVDSVKERIPSATEIKHEIVEVKSGRAALIRYSSSGPSGPEKNVQYSIPVDKQMYRLVAVTRATMVKHDAVLTYMLNSFKAPADPVPSKP